MAIEYKAIERVNPQDRTKKKFYASANSTGSTTAKELGTEIEQISALSGADVQSVLYLLTDLIPRHLAEGKSVHLGGLGNLRIIVSSNGEDSAEKVDVHSIKSARIVFTPSRELSKITADLHYKKLS